MKHFKIIALIVLITTLTNVKAQDTKPSLQETLDWIQGKINAYGENVATSYYCNQDQTETTTLLEGILLNHYDRHCNNRVTGTTEYSVKINDIYNFEYFPDDQKIIVLSTYGLKVAYTYHSDYGDENKPVSSFDLRLHWDAEPDLYNRIVKALSTLVSYNRTTLKETF